LIDPPRRSFVPDAGLSINNEVASWPDLANGASMQNMINPPALSTLLAGWLRGGISVELSVGATWLLYSQVLGNGTFGPLLPVLALFGVLWTVLVTVQCIFDHTLIIANDDLVVRTWGDALLGRTGRKFPLQRPLLTHTRRIRIGGGLRGARLSLSDFAGRRHQIAFSLIGFNELASALERSSLGYGSNNQISG
jgi:hypothetical protein